MKEQLALPAPSADKMKGKEIELYVKPDEIPKGAKTTDEVEKDLAAEKAKSPEELKSDLARLRAELAECGAKRGARAFTIKFGKKNYEIAHGAYTKAMQDYIRAELDASDVSDTEKKFHAMAMLDEEWATLRADTKERMEGTITGKLVKYLGDKDISKKKRIMRLVAVSAGAVVVGAGVGALTAGALGGGAAGAAIGMAVRGYKGFVVDASRRDREIKSQERGALLTDEYSEKSYEDILNIGTSDTSYTDNVVANSKESRKAGAKTALFALGGAAIGHALDHYNVGSKIWNGMFGENTPAVVAAGVPTPQNGASFREAEEARWKLFEQQEGRFHYNKGDNPFFDPNKPSAHAMGPALESRPELDMGIDGWNDLVQDRWVNSPEQFASVVSAMGIDGVPSDIDSADSLAEHFKVTPSAHADMHGKVIDLLNEPTTKVYEEPILNDYASEYGVGNPATGDVDLAWDNEVNGQRGTKIVIEFKDPNTGEMRKIELRKECGGQRIVEFQPAPVAEVPRSVWNPSTPVVNVETPRPPVPVDNPQPPVQPPIPEVPQPPVIPPIPDNPNPPIIDDGKQGRNPGSFADQGSGPLTGPIEVIQSVIGGGGRPIGGGLFETPHTDIATNSPGTIQNGTGQNPNITHEPQSTAANGSDQISQADTTGGSTQGDYGLAR